MQRRGASDAAGSACGLPFARYVGSAGACTKDFVSWGACLGDMEAAMELRHLRYFVAVAEAGSLTVAAEKRLHTAQPSLSRQIRDLEYEVGVQLMSRSVHDIELTAAGRAFLDHARLALTQAEAAAEAARRAAQPVKPTFAMGFQTGQEVDWLPRATSILCDELPNIEIRVSSDHSTMLADDLQRGKLDIAFLRREQKPDLEYSWSRRNRSSWSCRAIIRSLSARPSIRTISSAKHSSGYQACRACCVLLSTIICNDLE
jgi:DNA-binding transcriptional LysR family regulator